MPEYIPKDRRPIANIFRRNAESTVNFCVAHKISPNSISIASTSAAALASLCFYFGGAYLWLVVPGAFFCYVRLWCNMLDGMVALEAKIASKKGELFNELPDRVSDVLIFVGVAHSGLCYLPLGYACAILALMTAYIGTFGQAVGVGRQFGGLMSKPWRMVTLHVGSWLMLIFGRAEYQVSTLHFSILDGTLIVICLGCVQTILVRLKIISRRLDEAGTTSL